MHNCCRMLSIAAFLMGFLSAHAGIDLDVLRALPQEMDGARECVRVILQCTSLYEPVTTGRYGTALFESEQDLEQACRHNDGFIECVEAAKKFCVEGNIEHAEVLMIKNRLWVRDLCDKKSKWKKWYAKHAPCINREFPGADLCHAPAHIPASEGIVGACRHLDDVVDCRSKIFFRKCGEPASALYRRLAQLNDGREYLCNRHKQQDLDSPALIAAQMLNNVRTLMRNFSRIIRTTMTPEAAADVLQEIDPRDPYLKNPFDIDTDEFVKMLKGGIPKDIVDMLKDKGEDLVKHIRKDDASDSSPDDQLSCSNFAELYVPSFESNASFHVYGVSHGGEKSHLGSGQTMVHWKDFQQTPLDDLFCSWIDQGSSNRLFKCSIKITELKPQHQEEITRTRPVIISLYSVIDEVNHSDEILLTEMATICVENYQPSEDVSTEIYESAYPPKSTLREYMHDIHRSGDSWDEANKAAEQVACESTQADSASEGSYSLYHNPESHWEGSIELNGKENQEEAPDNELDVPFDANLSYISPDVYEIPEQRNVVDKKLSSLYDENYIKKTHSVEKHHLTYYSILDEVSKEDSSELAPNAPETCKSETPFIDCPNTDSSVDVDPVQSNPPHFSQDYYPNVQRILGTSIRPGLYIDARNIQTIDPLKGSHMRQFDMPPFDENVNYIVVGNPYIPSSETEDNVFVVTPSTKTVPADGTQLLDVTKFLEDEIENIYVEQIKEKI